MATGGQGFLAISRQASFGAATASWHYIPIISEGLTTNIEPLKEESIRQIYEEGESHDGVVSVEGDIVIEAHPTLIGNFLHGICGVSSTSAVLSGFVNQHIFTMTQDDFSQKCALPPYTIMVHRDVGSSYQFTDALFNGMTFEITAGGFMRMTIPVIARVSSLMDPETASFQASTPFAWDSASISVGAAANAEIETLSIGIENNLVGKTTLDGTRAFNSILRDGFRNFPISGQMDFTSQAEYNDFRVGSEQQLIVTITGETEINSGYYNIVKFDFPRFRYESYEANIGGPGQIMASFDGVGKYSLGSANALTITLQNTLGGY